MRPLPLHRGLGGFRLKHEGFVNCKATIYTLLDGPFNENGGFMDLWCQQL